MKFKLLLIILIAAFLYIFFKSNAWEITRVKEERGGVEYFVTKHSISWERFGDYVKTIPDQIKAKIDGWSRSY